MLASRIVSCHLPCLASFASHGPLSCLTACHPPLLSLHHPRSKIDPIANPLVRLFCLLTPQTRMSSRCSSPNCRRPPPPPPRTRQAWPARFLDEPPPPLHRCSLPSLAPLALHETHTHTLPLRLLVTEPVSFPTPTVLCILDAALDLNLHPLVFCPSVSSCLASPLRHHTAPISCSSANPTGALCFFSSSSRFVSKPTARLPRRLVATLSLPPARLPRTGSRYKLYRLHLPLSRLLYLYFAVPSWTRILLSPR